MGLPMPSPYKHPKTGVYYLRQRVPADLKDKARGKIVALPIAGALKSFSPGDSVKASLETKDPAEAKARYREADAALSKFWEALRNGPIRLTQKEVAERAGLVYKFFADTFEDDAESPKLWERSQRINAVVLKKAKLGKRPTYPLTVTQRDILEPRFGGFVDKLLIDTGEQVDQESRDKLLVSVSKHPAHVLRKFDRASGRASLNGKVFRSRISADDNQQHHEQQHRPRFSAGVFCI